MPRFVDLTGDRYGRLLVMHQAPNIIEKMAGRQSVAWECRCDCGTICIVRSNTLRRGHTRSCGCLHREMVGQVGKKNRTHGEGGTTSEYYTWRAMRARCLNPNNPAYKNYGGRGITICQRWLDSYENFLTDMGRRPTPQHSIDRIDNDLLVDSYSKANCRWATTEEQLANRRPYLRSVK